MRNELKMVNCLTCNSQFLQKKSWQKFCSVKCRNMDWWSKREVVLTKSYKDSLMKENSGKQISNDGNA